MFIKQTYVQRGNLDNECSKWSHICLKYFRLDCQMCLKALCCDDYLKHCNPVIILLSRQCKFVKKHAIAATLNN